MVFLTERIYSNSIGTIEDGWKGRLEDRRPASNGDPYKIGAVVISIRNRHVSGGVPRFELRASSMPRARFQTAPRPGSKRLAGPI